MYYIKSRKKKGNILTESPVLTTKKPSVFCVEIDSQNRLHGGFWIKNVLQTKEDLSYSTQIHWYMGRRSVWESLENLFYINKYSIKCLCLCYYMQPINSFIISVYPLIDVDCTVLN